MFDIIIQFVPYHLMQFQKLKHVVTRYFDTKFTEKSKQILRQPGLFEQIQICFSKIKKENWQIYDQAYISMV